MGLGRFINYKVLYILSYYAARFLCTIYTNGFDAIYVPCSTGLENVNVNNEDANHVEDTRTLKRTVGRPKVTGRIPPIGTTKKKNTNRKWKQLINTEKENGDPNNDNRKGNEIGNNSKTKRNSGKKEEAHEGQSKKNME